MTFRERVNKLDFRETIQSSNVASLFSSLGNQPVGLSLRQILVIAMLQISFIFCIHRPFLAPYSE